MQLFRRVVTAALVPVAAGTVLTVPIGPTAAAALPDGWVQLTDETETITIGVPPTWSQHNTAPSLATGEPAPQIVAGVDTTAFMDGYGASGVFYSTMPYVEVPPGMAASAVEAIGSAFADEHGCTTPGVQPYDDGTLAGVHGVYTGCADGIAEFHVLNAHRTDQSFSTFVVIAVRDPDPAGTADQILATLALAPGAATASNIAVATAPPPSTLAPFPAPSGSAPAAWTPVVDATNTMQISVPAAWADIDVAPAGESPNLYVAPDRQAANNDRGPFVAMNTVGYTAATEALATLGYYADLCAGKVTNSFDNGAIAGHITTYSECGDTGLTVYRVLGNSVTNTTDSLGVTIALAGGRHDAAVLDGLLSTARFVE